MASLLKTNTNTINEILNTINNLPEAGTDLPELTNEGTAADLLSGKELINSEGEKVIGTIPIKSPHAAGDVYSGIARHDEAYGIDIVPVDITTGYYEDSYYPVHLADLTITPSKSTQTKSIIGKSSMPYGTVTVNPIPSQYEDITNPLADLNAANGGTSATTMSAAVDNTETLAGEQATLIGQIQTALAGKTGSGTTNTLETFDCIVTLGEWSSGTGCSVFYTELDANATLCEKNIVVENRSEPIINFVKGTPVVVVWDSVDSYHKEFGMSIMAVKGNTYMYSYDPAVPLYSGKAKILLGPSGS